MLRIGILLVLVSIPIFVGSGRAVAQQGVATKELVAVMDLESIGATKAQISACSERLREELLQTNRFRLVDRSEMAKIMEEQALQQSGCTSQECMVKVGRVLGVRKLVTGRVTKVEDDLWMVSGMLLDVESAETLRVASVQHDGNFRSLLGPGIAALAAKLQVPTPSPSVAGVEARPAPSSKPVPTTARASALTDVPAFPSNVPIRTRASVAVFPILHEPCSDVFGTCGRLLPEKEIVQAVAQALTVQRNVEVKASYYPDGIPGTSLAEDSTLRLEGMWLGFFKKTPNPAAVTNKGQNLGTEMVLMLTTRYDIAKVMVDAFLVDVDTGHVFNNRFDTSRELSGGIRQDDFNGGIASLLTSARVRPFISIPTDDQGKSRSIAVLPISYTPCTGGLYQCNYAISREEMVNSIASALKFNKRITISASYYPSAIPGKSLAGDRSLAQFSWTEGFNPTPNTEYLVGKSKEFGTNALLLVQPRYDMTSVTFEVFYVDAARQALFKEKFSANRGISGKVDQGAIDEQFAAALDKMLNL